MKQLQHHHQHMHAGSHQDLPQGLLTLETMCLNMTLQSSLKASHPKLLYLQLLVMTTRRAFSGLFVDAQCTSLPLSELRSCWPLSCSSMSRDRLRSQQRATM